MIFITGTIILCQSGWMGERRKGKSSRAAKSKCDGAENETWEGKKLEWFMRKYQKAAGSDMDKVWSDGAPGRCAQVVSKAALLSDVMNSGFNDLLVSHKAWLIRIPLRGNALLSPEQVLSDRVTNQQPEICFKSFRFDDFERTFNKH